MIYLTIAAVEKIVVEHYAKQIKHLETANNQQHMKLLIILKEFQNDEDEHRRDAEKNALSNS